MVKGFLLELLAVLFHRTVAGAEKMSLDVIIY